MGSVMSDDLVARREEKRHVAVSIEKLGRAMNRSLLVNVVGPGAVRRRVLNEASRKVSSQRVYRLDGRIHGYGDVVEAFKSAVPIQGGKGGTIMIDNWSTRIVRRGDEESFRRWIEYMEPEHHTLVFGTRDPLTSAFGKRVQRLFSPRNLAGLCIVSCTRIAASNGKKDETNASVALGASAALLATAVGAAAIWRSQNERTEETQKDETDEPTRLQRALHNLKGGVFGEAERTNKDTKGGDSDPGKRQKKVEEIDQGETLKKAISIKDRDDAKVVLKEWRSSGMSVMKMVRVMGRVKGFQKRLDWMSEDECWELMTLGSIDVRDDDPNQWTRLADFADNARRWGEFLSFLADHDPRVAQETKAVGVELSDDEARTFGIHLKKVGLQPDEFTAGLFRASDLIRLFPEYRPDKQEQRAFLCHQFEKWLDNKKLGIRKQNETKSTTSRKSVSKDHFVSDEPIEVSSAGDPTRQRPVRKLYRLLVKLDGIEPLKLNLQGIDDYAELKGPTEPRFCEWVYARMEKRQLLDGLTGSLLRSSDKIELRRRLGLSPTPRQDSWPESLREVLTKIGVCEPELPPDIDTGERQLRTAKSYFYRTLNGEEIDAETYTEEKGVLDARKGMEKIFQVIVTFLWQGGLEEVMEAVIVEGHHEFHPDGIRNFDVNAYSEQTTADLLEILKTQSAGLLNHLLRSLSKECVKQQIHPPFLRGEKDRRELWPEALFQRCNALLQSLNKLHHDSLQNSDEEAQRHRDSLPDKLEKVVQALDVGMLRIPRPVQFFRKYDDGHGVHFEGYTSDNQRIWFYEVRQDYELRKPYLFLAATNPSAVDMTCVPLSKVLGE